MNDNKIREVRGNRLYRQNEIMNTNIPPVENNEVRNNNHPYYLLSDDQNYKILVLYLLKNLNNDIKQIILDILVTKEELLLEQEDFEEITQLMNQNWYEIDLNLSDIDSDWYYSD